MAVRLALSVAMVLAGALLWPPATGAQTPPATPTPDTFQFCKGDPATTVCFGFANDEPRTIVLRPFPGAASHRVSGSFRADRVNPADPCLPPREMQQIHRAFDENLPATETRFALPVPPDPAPDRWGLDDVEFTIIALDASGAEIARGGTFIQTDPFCLAAAASDAGTALLPAAGAGAREGKSQPTSALLAICAAVVAVTAFFAYARIRAS